MMRSFRPVIWIGSLPLGAVSENTKKDQKAAGTAAEIGVSAPLCAGWLCGFFFFLSLLVVHGRGQSYSEQNKQLTLFCCIANGEQRERSAIVILQYVWAA